MFSKNKFLFRAMYYTYQVNLGKLDIFTGKRSKKKKKKNILRKYFVAVLQD